MARLLQGDVGSGKTVVAITALLISALNGFQGAFMAPTEILAEQHFKTISSLLSRMASEERRENMHSYSGILPDRELTLALLTGGLSAKEKEDVQTGIKSGNVDIVIGTHALIQKSVSFSKLGLASSTEQHRCGVSQRSALRLKGYIPHILVMTATPIPRTLALTLYGDLDLSIINELPPGRKIVKTQWIAQESREKAYDFLRQKVRAGKQEFIVCPLIEESESIEAKAARVEYERLSEQVFPDLKLCLLHGKLSQDEKEKIMYSFRQGEYDIMVATPVVEVGIDIPNATVMLVEAAERFGLSQLHQFRGRVGRGENQSYCILLAGNPSPEGKQRLKAIENIYDGFALAEKDLEIRGPGEFFGTSQSGLPDLRMARLSDTRILEEARREAIALFNRDKKLKLSGHSLLAAELRRVCRIIVNGAE
jgi:ATP-dependent DNA helicase RecG